jgi:hypothetical protein
MTITNSSTSMEIVRQFLAAFAYQDKDTLNDLFAPNLKYNFTCQEKVQSGFSREDASNLVLQERERWVQSRMDVKSWQNDDGKITVTFHVQYGNDIFTEYLEYVAGLRIEQGVIQCLKMNCTEQKLKAPVWDTPKVTGSSLASAN